MTRVVVAGAHLPTRTGIRLVLERNGFEICAEATDAKGAVAAVLREKPELCLVDADLPGGAMLATARITTRAPATDTIVLAAQADEQGVVDALNAGASGYLPLDGDPDGLIRALRAVRRGEPAVPRSLLGPVVDQFRVRERRRRVSVRGGIEVELTRRQSEVLELFRDGLGTTEIAGRLGLSPVTVRRHLSLVLEKLGVSDRAAARHLLEEEESA
ncbi:MAG TPA: response regulator transcription factor [Gaiellaceae bacterium]|nr:response regulator transcription factor [Gaiellaceae bacterium]